MILHFIINLAAISPPFEFFKQKIRCMQLFYKYTTFIKSMSLDVDSEIYTNYFFFYKLLKFSVYYHIKLLFYL